MHDISIVKLEKGNIPESVKEIIEPNHEQLNNIQFASKFQYLQLVGLIEHYELQVSVLKEKNSRLKDLLRKSRVELDKCNEYQNEISRLKEENKRMSLKLQIGDSTTSKDMISNGDEINEITVEEYVTSSRGRSRPRDTAKESGREVRDSEDFLSKMKRFNQLKSAEETSRANKAPVIDVISQGRRSRPMNDLSSFNIQAESTTIRKKDRSKSMQLIPSKGRSFFQGDISKMLSPMATSTAGDFSSVGDIDGHGGDTSTVRRDWATRRQTYGRGVSSNSNSNSSGNSSGSGSGRGKSGQSGSIIGAESNLRVKKLFMFKPPSRSISSRGGLRVGGQGCIGVLRSQGELFKR